MGAVSASKYTVQAGWDDVPHLDEKTKAELLEGTHPRLREARSKGYPHLGAGAIYPIAWEEVSVEPFAIPVFWKRAYALDVGWNCTAAIWGAQDPADNTLYLYAEYSKAQAIPQVHATAIKARGAWMTGAIDPASRGRSQVDGEQLFATYSDCDLRLVPANNTVEPGLYEVWSLLTTGRLKLFRTLQHTEIEYRRYRRETKADENGVERTKVVKKDDHCMDAMRYLVMTWPRIAKVKPADGAVGEGWKAADQLAGY